jgi:hypothetical protein
MNYRVLRVEDLQRKIVEVDNGCNYSFHHLVVQ